MLPSVLEFPPCTLSKSGLYISENCEWNEYGDWSECSATCGGGTHYRERTKKQEAEHGGQNCTGDAREEAACNTHNCAGTHKQGFISI